MRWKPCFACTFRDPVQFCLFSSMYIEKRRNWGLKKSYMPCRSTLLITPMQLVITLTVVWRTRFLQVMPHRRGKRFNTDLSSWRKGWYGGWVMAARFAYGEIYGYQNHTPTGLCRTEGAADYVEWLSCSQRMANGEWMSSNATSRPWTLMR